MADHLEPQPSAEDVRAFVKIYDHEGYRSRPIQRSFPQGKPENLISGLEHLLSQYHHNEQGKVTRNRVTWRLSKAGNHITLFLLVHTTEIIDKILQALEAATQATGHHPHHAYHFEKPAERCIFGVLCTTHRPKGLSLKDVKVAQQITKAVQELLNQHPQDLKVIWDGAKDTTNKLRELMETEMRIAKRDGAAAAMREKNEDVDGEELDRTFGVTVPLRKLVEASKDTMARQYALAQSLQKATREQSETQPAPLIHYHMGSGKSRRRPKSAKSASDVSGSESGSESTPTSRHVFRSVSVGTQDPSLTDDAPSEGATKKHPVLDESDLDCENAVPIDPPVRRVKSTSSQHKESPQPKPDGEDPTYH